MANGRCYIHGGRTPKGDDWHKPRWPDRERPDANEKLSEKLRSLEKRANRRRRKLKTMTAEERAAHDAWQATHTPGPAAARRRRRAQKLQNQEAAWIIAGASPPPSPRPAPPITAMPPKETPMSKKILPPDVSPTMVEADLAVRVRTEGLPAAYKAALEVCQDKKAAPAARATAAGWIFRVAGFDAKKNDDRGRQLYEMSADELAAEAQRAQGELDRLEALRARGRRFEDDASDDEESDCSDRDQIEQDDGPEANAFD